MAEELELDEEPSFEALIEAVRRYPCIWKVLQRCEGTRECMEEGLHGNWDQRGLRSLSGVAMGGFGGPWPPPKLWGAKIVYFVSSSIERCSHTVQV